MGGLKTDYASVELLPNAKIKPRNFSPQKVGTKYGEL